MHHFARADRWLPDSRCAASGTTIEKMEGPRMDLRGNWNYPTTVRFGAGRASELGEAVKAAGMKNPLFVTDPTVANMPMTRQAMDTLNAAGIAAKLFSGVQPNPIEANVAQGVAAFKAGGHDGV